MCAYIADFSCNVFGTRHNYLTKHNIELTFSSSKIRDAKCLILDEKRCL